MQGSAAEYARARGISRQAVHKLIDQGKIPARRDGRNVTIDFAAADRARNDSRARAVVDDALSGADEDADEEEAPAAAASPARPQSSLNAVATREKFYRSELLKMEVAEREGRLLPREALVLAANEASRAIGRDIDQLAAFADEITSVALARGVAGVREILRERARQMRVGMARHLATLAADWASEGKGGVDAAA